MSASRWIRFADRDGQVWVAALRGVSPWVADADLPLPAPPWRPRVVLRSGAVAAAAEVTARRGGLRLRLAAAVALDEWHGARIELHADPAP